jgi:hypothetical protein
MNFKNLNCILLALCFPILLTAQEGNCVVFSTDGTSFHLALDNKFQNKDANTNVKVTHIPEGDYWVTVFFADKTRKAFKSNIRILGKKENSFQIEKDDDSWKLKQYSSVPTAQVQSTSNKQTVLTYNATGVSIQGMNNATEMDKDMVEQRTEVVRVYGTIEEEAKSKRAGKFSGSSADIDGEKEVAATAPVPTPETVTKTENATEEKEGTTIINKYIETTNADGTTSIVQETTTLIKQIVVRDGQRQMRTKRNLAFTPTDLTCLPMEKETFTNLKKEIQSLEADHRLSVAQNGIKDQCMTSNQIKAIGDLILSDVDRNQFAITAKKGCANPRKFPYTISDVVVLSEEPKVETEVPVKEEPVVVAEPAKEKTKAELKAELKALKAKQKEEKAAAKAKVKAEKAAAKAKAKAEKAAAKAKAKAEKEAAKKK